MRVVAGKYRGRPLKGPACSGVRPTADRVKEALFNVLGAAVGDAEFLDLFAGSGAIGIEALSRGAKAVVFNDENQRSLKLALANLTSMDAEDKAKARLLRLPAERALELLAAEGAAFDLIFLDPPFAAGLLEKTIDRIVGLNLLKPNGILAAEHSVKQSLNNLPFTAVKVRNYGEIRLTFCENRL